MGIAFNGTSTRLTWAGQMLSSFPFTFFAWIKPSAASVNYSIIDAADTGQNHGARLYCSTSGYIRASVLVSGTGYTVDSSEGTDTSAWQPVMIVCASATSRKIYYKNDVTVEETANSGTPTWASANQFAIGAFTGGSLWFNGDIAEVAIWGSALSAGNWDTLQGDTLPESVDSGNLIESWSLFDASTLAGTVSRTLTAANATTSATHPVASRTGGGGGGSAAGAAAHYYRQLQG